VAAPCWRPWRSGPKVRIAVLEPEHGRVTRKTKKHVHYGSGRMQARAQHQQSGHGLFPESRRGICLSILARRSPAWGDKLALIMTRDALLQSSWPCLGCEGQWATGRGTRGSGPTTGPDPTESSWHNGQRPSPGISCNFSSCASKADDAQVPCK
jgi:hypothetical protein